MHEAGTSPTIYLPGASVVGALIVLYSGRRAGLPIGRIVALLLITTLAAWAGSKLDSVIERGGRLGTLAWELENGYRYPGALIALAFTLPLVRRMLPGLSWLAVADLVAPAIGFGMAAARLCCFLGGCCFGTVSTLPWAVRFGPHSAAWEYQLSHGLIAPAAAASLPVHPLQLYFALLALGLGVFLLWLQPRKSFDGQVFLSYLVLHDTGKFLLEFLRAQPAPHVQLFSLLSALAAAAVIITVVRRSGFRSRRVGHVECAAERSTGLPRRLGAS